jgi:membrane protein required for colicin V production
MMIDTLLVLLIAIALIRGFFKGLIVAVFTLLAYIFGLAAAIAFSRLAAVWLEGLLHTASRWVPLIAFLLVLAGVVLLVRTVALLLEKMAEGLALGWLNRLGGMFFYVVLYVTVYSVLLYYLARMRLISADTLQHSVTYPYIVQMAPRIVGSVGLLLPWFQDIFKELDKFFDKVAP